MGSLQRTPTYRRETDPYGTRLSDKDLSMSGTQQTESSYVDLESLLDMKAESTKTVKVTFTGEGSQLAIFKNNSDVSASEDKRPGDGEPNDNVGSLKNMGCISINEKCANDPRAQESANEFSDSFETASSSEVPTKNDDFKDCPEAPPDNLDALPRSQNEIVPRDLNPKKSCSEMEELQYTDVHLSRKSESEDDVSVVLSDPRVPTATEDDSHYITTHEIQLSELDHDVDYDFGLGSCWDIEDDNLVYSFVDYASFDSDETTGGKQDRILARVKSNQAQTNNTARRATSRAAVSTKLENDLCDMDKCASSDESLSKNQNGSGNSAGQIHLSIKTTSRAINELSNVQEKENIRYHAKHEGDMSRYVFRGADTKAEKICDSAKCFIAAPGRLHFGSKLKGKDVYGYSSGASSAVSELDDADKEVRNLTARAFRSLACPYFDAINFGASSESSASEHGLGINRWSAFVDLKYDMTQGREQNLVSHKSATSTFEIAKNADGKGIKGLTLANIKAPQTNILALNGKLSDAQSPSSSSKKIELLGKFGQEQTGVITLTETLNFRCNVQAGVPGCERRAKFAQKAEGSRSTDEVTHTLPMDLGSEASKQPCNPVGTMEDTHKKAIFASSLLKNVISKKMQFEQERKMERGEISEPAAPLSPCFHNKEHELQKERLRSESRGLQRQSSKFSEADSDNTVVFLDELGDIVDNNSCGTKDESQREDILTLASGTNLEQTNEAGFDTKKGAFEASKSTLLRSQNSAFRSWRDAELEFQKEHKNDKTPAVKSTSSAGNLGETDVEIQVDSNKLTKMSHLFVPSIQVLSEDSVVVKPLPKMKYSTRSAADQGELRSDNTLYVADVARSVVTSKSPEIKISLRSVKENKCNPFNIAKLLTPNIGCNAANLIKTADDSKCQAFTASLKGDASEKVPHFMVRDIRDNKCKLQTPIHQVRDVRKLVKSSYHFVSLDNSESKVTASGVADLLSDHRASKQGPGRNLASISPIVIKCQSVNTNSNVKQSGNLIEVLKRRPAENISETDRSSPQLAVEGAKSGNAQVHRLTGKTPLVFVKQPNGDLSEALIGVNIETKTAKRKQEKVPDTGEKKPESNMSNQVALEKLQAAVKTMEQLYVFDRNEWKRKTEPRPITDSHVLSLIASEEHGNLGRTEMEEDMGNIATSFAAGNIERLARRDSYPDADRSPPPTQATVPVSETFPKREEKEFLKTFHIPFGRDEKDGLKSHQSGAVSDKKVFTMSHCQKASAGSGSSNKVQQPYASTQMPFSNKSLTPKSPKAPLSLKISHPKRAMEEREKPNGSEAERPFPAQHNASSTTDSENYLTIPVKGHASDTKPAATPVREQMARQSPKRATVVMETRSPETPTATIYHHPLPLAQPQVICLSPSVAPPTAIEPFQPTQRKMLLDPTTGHYYLVDTPVQPATKRLFDPETGQYVDVPMPQAPMTPMPMPISPLALSTAAYGPTYMIYPGFLPASTAMLPTRTVQPHLSMHSESDNGDKVSTHAGQQGEVAYLESPYYIHTGMSQQVPTSQHVSTRGSKGISNGKPIISITSQQGPRIIAPPSFDGTTMSFVVEHR